MVDILDIVVFGVVLSGFWRVEIGHRGFWCRFGGFSGIPDCILRRGAPPIGYAPPGEQHGF